MMARLVAVLVCVLVQPSLQYNRRSVCPCSVLTSSDMYSSLEEFIETTSTKYYQLNCCKSFVNTTNQSDININWWYKGVRFPWGRVVSSFRLGYCGRGSRESLESDGVLLEDEGQFLCSLSSASSGLVLLNKTFNLCVNRNDELRGPPIKSVSTGDSWALLGEEVTFQCSAFVGRQACGKDSATTLRENLKWIKETQPGVWVDANRLTNTNITVLKEEKGTVRSELSVSEVQRTHYGRYRCTITNRQGSVHHTLTLKQGVPPSERVALGYRTAIVVMVAAALCFTITTVVWHRCRLAFAFYFRGRVTKGIKTDDGQVDVLVVHGDSATYWVGSVLLPVLEDTYHYKCFLPQRDMLAGDQVAESILAVLSRCRRVVVVVTPCLLDSSWATWSAYSGIQAALTTPARILALVLQEPNMKIGTHEKNSLLEVLRVVKKVRVPIECGQQPDDDQQQKEEDFFTASFNKTENNLKLTEGNPKFFFYRGSCDMKVDKNSDDKFNTAADDALRSNIKLSLPELTQLPGSHSPGSQRLSNMVSVSEAASRESLEPDKKTATTENLTFTQDNEDNPGSPCSITPFILTSPQNTCKDRSHSTQDSVCTAMSRCMQAVCVGNPKQVFWQTVRLQLGPPSLHTIQQ